MASWGQLARVGVEGTGSYGAGLARHLAAAGVAVVEVNRPNRQTRRRRGKSAVTDAEAAARAALSGDATARPKAGDGPVEAIRTLRVARRSAIKARTQAINQIHDLIVTAPDALKDQLGGLRTGALIDACARLRPNPTDHQVTAAAKQALRALARRHRALSAEINELDAELLALCAEANPALLAAPGVGPEVAATLLVTAGDNPQRMATNASFAALCGASPIEASSGQHIRHRLNRGGDRQANNALWRIAMVRLRYDERTIAYAQRAQHRARPAERSSAASNATSREKSTNCSPTRRRCPAAHTYATFDTTQASPSPTPHEPSTPAPPTSHNSNEASATTTTSPPTTRTGSPKSPLDTHRASRDNSSTPANPTGPSSTASLPAEIRSAR